MARKATIQILRGSNKSADETTVLGAGELFYDLQTGLLYIGDGDPNHNLKWLYDNKKCLITLDNLSGSYPKDTIAIGNGAQARVNNAIAIGSSAKTTSVTQSSSSIAIGNGANGDASQCVVIGKDSTCRGHSSISIGYNSTCDSSAYDACQIGNGTNSTANSLKFRNTTIVDGNGKINANTAKDYDTSSGTIKDAVDNLTTNLTTLDGKIYGTSKRVLFWNIGHTFSNVNKNYSIRTGGSGSAGDWTGRTLEMEFSNGYIVRFMVVQEANASLSYFIIGGKMSGTLVRTIIAKVYQSYDIDRWNLNIETNGDGEVSYEITLEKIYEIVENQ